MEKKKLIITSMKIKIKNLKMYFYRKNKKIKDLKIYFRVNFYKNCYNKIFMMYSRE